MALTVTAACEMFRGFERFGGGRFYRAVGPVPLKIAPYRGGHGCLAVPFSRGVFGAAVRVRRKQSFADVDAFAGHLRAPPDARRNRRARVRCRGALIGVLYVCSDTPDAFGAAEAVALEPVLHEIFATPVRQGLNTLSAGTQ